MTGSIYFLQVDGGGPIKIGFTRAVVSSRVTALQHSSPYILHWIGYFQGVRTDETAAHKKLHGSRLRNEWFHPTLEVLSFIREKSPNFDKSEYFKIVFLDEHRSLVKRVLHRRRYSDGNWDAIATAGGLNRHALYQWLSGANPIQSNTAKACANRAAEIIASRAACTPSAIGSGF